MLDIEASMCRKCTYVACNKWASSSIFIPKVQALLTQQTYPSKRTESGTCPTQPSILFPGRFSPYHILSNVTFYTNRGENLLPA